MATLDENPENANNALQKYRDFLIAAEQKSQEDYDKTVIALSGGALGISFAFATDIVGGQSLTQPICCPFAETVLTLLNLSPTLHT